MDGWKTARWRASMQLSAPATCPGRKGKAHDKIARKPRAGLCAGVIQIRQCRGAAVPRFGSRESGEQQRQNARAVKIASRHGKSRTARR